MSLEEIKESFSSLSPKAILLTLSIVLPAIGGTAYVAITKYNQVTELVDNYSPYNDAELRRELSETKAQLAGLQSSVNNIKDGMVLTSNQLVSVSEKASTAKGEAMEAKAIANGNARETQAALGGVREEVKATREGIEAKMKALQRATTNPLGN
jgi:chromosome segregation ATPase